MRGCEEDAPKQTAILGSVLSERQQLSHSILCRETAAASHSLM